jgi:hypothetical protein
MLASWRDEQQLQQPFRECCCMEKNHQQVVVVEVTIQLVVLLLMLVLLMKSDDAWYKPTTRLGDTMCNNTFGCREVNLDCKYRTCRACWEERRIEDWGVQRDSTDTDSWNQQQWLQRGGVGVAVAIATAAIAEAVSLLPRAKQQLVAVVSDDVYGWCSSLHRRPSRIPDTHAWVGQAQRRSRTRRNENANDM